MRGKDSCTCGKSIPWESVQIQLSKDYIGKFYTCECGNRPSVRYLRGDMEKRFKNIYNKLVSNLRGK